MYSSMAILNRENTHKSLEVMLQGTICNDDFKRNAALQHWFYVVSNGCGLVLTFEPCVALKIVVANCPV